MQQMRYMMNTSSVLNLFKLPFGVRQQVLEYYQFLLYKYGKEAPKQPIVDKATFVTSMRNNRFVLPADYRFDREEAK